MACWDQNRWRWIFKWPFFTAQRVSNTRSLKGGLVRYHRSAYVFSVVCHFFDAINCEANGPIFKVLSFTHPQNVKDVYVSVCVFVCSWECVRSNVSNTINFQTNLPSLPWRRSWGAVCWLLNRCEGSWGRFIQPEGSQSVDSWKAAACLQAKMVWLCCYFIHHRCFPPHHRWREKNYYSVECTFSTFSIYQCPGK